MAATRTPLKPWQFSLRTLFKYVTMVAMLFGAWALFVACVRSYDEWKYPYGHSHCCEKILGATLDEYARANGGNFPAEEGPTPEGSLSLLYPKYADANLLRGKTVPEVEVAAILARGKPLGPSSCGWHYVEGLTINDDPRLALFWDKVGLGHNGERFSVPGHYVHFLNWDAKFIPDTEWDSFLSEQQELLVARKLKSATPTATPSGN